MTTASQFVDLYAILGVDQAASDDEIRQAIKNQRRTWIRRQSLPDPERRAEAEARIHALDRAYQVLLDRTKRKQYDRELHEHATSIPSLPSTSDVADGDWLARAQAYLRDGNPSGANYAAREAVNQRGADPEAWFVRAHSSFLLGNGADAAYEFGEAIRLRPDEAMYHYSLGDVHAAQGKWRSAMTCYDRAIKLDPGNPLYQTAKAQGYLQNDLADKALEIMERVVEKHPSNQAALFFLAVALHDSALESLGKVRDTAPGAGYVIVSQAQIDLVETRAAHIRRLEVDDPDVEEMAANLEELAAQARKVQWRIEGSMPWLVGFLILSVLPMIAGSDMGGGITTWGFFCGIAIVSLYVFLRRRPLWRHRRRDMALSLESEGI